MSIKELQLETLRKKNRITLIMLIISVILGVAVEASLGKALQLSSSMFHYRIFTSVQPINETNLLFGDSWSNDYSRNDYFN